MTTTIAPRDPDSARWLGPSFALSAGSPSSAALLLAGYRDQLSVWEQRAPDPLKAVVTPWGKPALGWGQLGLLKRRSEWTSWELEIIPDGKPADSDLQLSEDYVLGKGASDLLRALPAIGSSPINANREIEVPPALHKLGVVAVADVLLTTLPSRRADMTAPIVYCSRYVRIALAKTGFLVSWSAPRGRWDPELVRWPHHGVPSRSKEWLNHALPNMDTDPSVRLLAFMRDVLEHQMYHLQNWLLELELWEQHLFQELTAGKTTFDGLDFTDLRVDLGHLANYLSSARLAQRSIKRRAENARAFQSPEVKATMLAGAQELDDRLNRHAERLREAFALMANAASGEQMYVAERQRKASERLQQTVTFVTVIFLVPSIVVGIFASQVREVTNGKADLYELLTIMVTAGLIAAIALRVFRRAVLVPSTARNNLLVGLALSVAAVADALVPTHGAPSGASFAALAAGGIALGYGTISAILVRQRKTQIRGDSEP